MTWVGGKQLFMCHNRATSHKTWNGSWREQKQDGYNRRVRVTDDRGPSREVPDDKRSKERGTRRFKFREERYQEIKVYRREVPDDKRSQKRGTRR